MGMSDSLLEREGSFLEDVAFEMKSEGCTGVSSMKGVREDLPSIGLSLQMARDLAGTSDDL